MINTDELKDEGLTNKFTVIRNDTGEEIEARTFTLLPESDPIGGAALLFYADIVAMLTGNESPLLAEVEMMLKSVPNQDGEGDMYDAATRLYERNLDGICG